MLHDTLVLLNHYHCSFLLLFLLDVIFIYLTFLVCKYQGIPEQAEVPPVARVPASGPPANSPAQPPQPAQPAAVPSSGPNANPLDLFPQVVIALFLLIDFWGD